VLPILVSGKRISSAGCSLFVTEGPLPLSVVDSEIEGNEREWFGFYSVSVYWYSNDGQRVALAAERATLSRAGARTKSTPEQLVSVRPHRWLARNPDELATVIDPSRRRTTTSIRSRPSSGASSTDRDRIPRRTEHRSRLFHARLQVTATRSIA
jgi:hypothetical protein